MHAAAGQAERRSAAGQSSAQADVISDGFGSSVRESVFTY